jgi:hypothetical protein
MPPKKQSKGHLLIRDIKGFDPQQKTFELISAD